MAYAKSYSASAKSFFSAWHTASNAKVENVLIMEKTWT